MKRWTLPVCVIALLACFALAQESAPSTASAPLAASQATSQPSSAPATDPAVMAILNRLDEAGRKYPTLVANLHYYVKMLQLGDTEEYTGKVYWQGESGDSPSRFRIHFDTKKQGDGPRAANVVDYVFDGSWLTTRKENVKQMVKWQVAPPGEKKNALQLGQGPFLVPFGQKADDVLKFFTVTTRPAQPGDPANTDYLKLVTRPHAKEQSKAEVEWAELWVTKDTGLPVKIVTQDTNENITTVDFTKIEMPSELPKNTFDLPQPPRDWEYRVQPFQNEP